MPGPTTTLKGGSVSSVPGTFTSVALDDLDVADRADRADNCAGSRRRLGPSPTCGDRLDSAQGVHPKIVSEMLGHSSIAITLDLYSHVTPTMQKAAVEALDAVLSG